MIKLTKVDDEKNSGESLCAWETMNHIHRHVGSGSSNHNLILFKHVDFSQSI